MTNDTLNSLAQQIPDIVAFIILVGIMLRYMDKWNKQFLSSLHENTEQLKKNTEEQGQLKEIIVALVNMTTQYEREGRSAMRKVSILADRKKKR